MEIIPFVPHIEQEIYPSSGDVRTRFVGFRYAECNESRDDEEEEEEKDSSVFRGDRKACSEFSIKAQKEARLKFRAVSRSMMIISHFTYPVEMRNVVDGPMVKKHWKNFLSRLKCRFPGIRYAWVLEFQVNTEMPHFHVLFDRFIDKGLVSRLWYEVVASDLEKHLRAGTRVEFIRHRDRVSDYLLKYLNKKEQKEVPSWFQRVGRFWGYSRNSVEKVVRVIEVSSDDFSGHCSAKKEIRLFRRWYHAKNREWNEKRIAKTKKEGSSFKGYRWRWRGSGFIAWGGAEVLFRLIDFQGSDLIWKENTN